MWRYLHVILILIVAACQGSGSDSSSDSAASDLMSCDQLTADQVKKIMGWEDQSLVMNTKDELADGRISICFMKTDQGETLLTRVERGTETFRRARLFESRMRTLIEKGDNKYDNYHEVTLGSGDQSVFASRANSVIKRKGQYFVTRVANDLMISFETEHAGRSDDEIKGKIDELLQAFL